MFEGIFKQPAENAAQFLSDSKFLERTIKLPGIQPVRLVGGIALFYNYSASKAVV